MADPAQNPENYVLLSILTTSQSESVLLKKNKWLKWNELAKKNHLIKVTLSITRYFNSVCWQSTILLTKPLTYYSGVGVSSCSNGYDLFHKIVT